MATVLKFEKIKRLIDTQQLLREIETGSIVELGHVIKTPEIGRTREDQSTIADLTGVTILFP